MTNDDIHYFQLRAREERQRAIAAADHTTGKVHAELARLYEAAAGRLHEDEQLRSSRVALNRSQQLLQDTSMQVAANKVLPTGGIAGEER